MNKQIKKIRERLCDDSNEVFAKRVGENPNTTSNWISRRIGRDVIDKILNAFPEVNVAWFFTGEGAMLKSESRDETITAHEATEMQTKVERISKLIGYQKRNSIYDNILKIRKKKGYSQENVASHLGMKQAGYGLIENGNRGLEYNVLLQIAVFFEMDVIDIITYPDKYIDEKTASTSLESKTTRVLVEIDVNNDEFIKMGLKDKIIQVLNK